MEKNKLKEILEKHRKWWFGEEGGERAVLRGADLRGADLRGAVLRSADLCGADLRGADLRGADLSDAYLRGADLRGADLSDAYLRGADLVGATIATFASDADENTIWPHFQIPQEGELIVWGKKGAKLVKMRIPAEAKRTASLIGRKCRAEYVETLWIEGDAKTIMTDRDCTYTVYGRTYPDSYDADPKVECSNGIHFFLTKKEAEEWN